MFADERRQIILDHIAANGAVSVKELARTVGTSEVTVRRDLSLLEAQGLLGRRHGGAVVVGGLSHEATYADKAGLASAEKAAIGAVAAELVSDGDAISVGAGTTTHALAKHLIRRSDLTVMTNSLLVAYALASARGVDVVVSGGTVRGSIYALVGSGAEQTLASMRTRRLFLSGNGLSPERGLSTPNLHVAGVDRAMVSAAEQVVVLADHTKVGVETMVQTVPVEAITHLVTDARTPEHLLEGFRRRGVAVHVAHVPAGDGAGAPPGTVAAEAPGA
ncbi:DeoR/GlpR family DNA-binding transcription regulator [Vallicoccus soli]|uniref:DeoR/GlpR transcriptional regulator n=1 Tax=Vallicoccus soli TaxID=2339232 RepID=A0A3A3YUC3_9ACTN|nr:DeoR/GlpR family DNA-binding transcription regulator [Vallicoccus soli]RJK94295.1 DeoR/GlpR transcriptional regulator [Vallicoccus soli]